MNLRLLGLSPELLGLNLEHFGLNPVFLGSNPGLIGLNPAFVGPASVAVLALKCGTPHVSQKGKSPRDRVLLDFVDE